MRHWVFVRGGVLGLTAATGMVALGQPPKAPAPGLTPGAPGGLTSPGSPNPGVAATVNGEAIRMDDVDAVIRTRLVGTPLTPAQIHRLRTEVVAELIDDLLLKQFLRRHGPKVEPAEIDRHLKALSDSLAKQGKTLADFYRETNQTEASVRETWMILLQLSRYVEEHVSDEQLRQYYQANKEVFDRAEVRVSHIVVRVGANAPAGERAAAKQKLQTLRADILAGKIDFAAAAKKYSQCPSAPSGGDLGYIPRKGMLDEAFCKAAFALKPGELSEVVEAEFGVHLIRVTDRKPGTPSTFEKCAEDVREAFTDDFRTELIARLRKQAQIQVTVP